VRKLLFILGLLPMIAFAGGVDVGMAPPSQNGFNGFYVGAGVGVVHPTYETLSDTTTLDVPFFSSGHVLDQLWYSARHTTNHVIGNLFAGYGMTWNSFYLGGEVSINLGSTKAGTNTFTRGGGPPLVNEVLINEVTVKLRSFEADLDAMPGFLLTPHTLLFARIGAAFNKLKLNSNSFGEDFATSPGVAGVNLANNKSTVGVRAGLGLQEQFSDNFSIRADYIYTYYGRISVAGGTDFSGSTNDSLFNTTTVKASKQVVMLSLVYHI